MNQSAHILLIDAPLRDDYGTEIASVSWIDINKSHVSFFTEPACRPLSDKDVSAGKMDDKRQYFSISFRHLVDTGVLSDKKCTITFPISIKDTESNALVALLSKRPTISPFSSTSDYSSSDLNIGLADGSRRIESDPSHIEIIIKRSEFSNLKSTLKMRGAEMLMENEVDESSASTIASIKSKMSRKNPKEVTRNHIELSTKFANKFPDRLFDAEDYIVNQLTKEPYSPSKSLKDHSQDDLKSSMKSYVSEDNSIDLKTPAYKVQLFSQAAETLHNRKVSKSQPRSIVTPLVSTPMRPGKKQFSKNIGVLETLVAVMGVVDTNEASKTYESVESFLTNPITQDLSTAIRNYDDAISNILKGINSLSTAQKRLVDLREIPFETNWVQDASKLIHDGINNRNEFKRRNEMKLLSNWLNLSK